MYIAGLDINHAQGIEAFVASSTLIGSLLFTRAQLKVLNAAVKSAGPIQSKTPFLARIATTAHAVAFTVPPIVYWVGVGVNGLDQPEWMQKYSLPDEWQASLGLGGYSMVRSLAALACTVWLPTSLITVTRELGSQFSPIGVREKATVVSTGPYAWVRHPMYTAVLIAQPLFAAAAWSWVPLYAFGVIAAGFIVKIPYEEGLILERAEVKDAYAEYKKKVPYRLIPYVW